MAKVIKIAGKIKKREEETKAALLEQLAAATKKQKQFQVHYREQELRTLYIDREGGKVYGRSPNDSEVLPFNND